MGPRGRGVAVARAVVVLTDGQQESDTASAMRQARDLQAAGMRLIVIGLGPDADRDFLERLAGPGERAYIAPEPEDLAQIYEAIGRTISCRPDDYWARRCG